MHLDIQIELVDGTEEVGMYGFIVDEKILEGITIGGLGYDTIKRQFGENLRAFLGEMHDAGHIKLKDN